MFKSISKGKLVKLAAATAALGSIAAIGFVGNSPAQADPIQYTDPLFGFGSDTLQDVTNAFAGFSGGNFFTPLKSDNGKVIVSWDAFPPGTQPSTTPTCIVPQRGTGQIVRPNGSGAGRQALSATVGGTNFPTSGTACGGPRPMSKIVDFARSSGLSGTVQTGGPIQFVPAFKDALTFAYIRPSGPPITSLARDQLSAIHAARPQVIDPDNDPVTPNSVAVIACGIQTASGTYQTWMGNLGLVTDGTGDALGTGVCNNVGTGAAAGRVQENNSPDLAAKALLLGSMQADACDLVIDNVLASCANAQLIVGYSASQFIARGNSVAFPNSSLGTNGGLGLTNGVPAITGAPGSFAPNPTYYDDQTFGRTVYYVVAFEAVEPGGALASPAIQDMFITTGPTDRAKFCTAAEPGQTAGSTITKFGFLQIPTCGEINNNLRRNFFT